VFGEGHGVTLPVAGAALMVAHLLLKQSGKKLFQVSGFKFQVKPEGTMGPET
jgi:hypothetical protein